MGNLVADAMRGEVPGRRGGADQLRRPARRPAARRRRRAGEQPGEITWGEVFAVLPFGNRTVIETLTGAQLTAALLNGVQPGRATRRSPPAASRRSPGSRSTFHCDGHDAGDHGQRAPKGPAGRSRRSARPTPSASSPTTSCSRAATATRRSRQGTDVLQPGDALLDVVIDYITPTRRWRRSSRAGSRAAEPQGGLRRAARAPGPPGSSDPHARPLSVGEHDAPVVAHADLREAGAEDGVGAALVVDLARGVVVPHHEPQRGLVVPAARSAASRGRRWSSRTRSRAGGPCAPRCAAASAGRRRRRPASRCRCSARRRTRCRTRSRRCARAGSRRSSPRPGA